MFAKKLRPKQAAKNGHWAYSNRTSCLEVEQAQFFCPSQARALSVKPEQARACPNYPRACFEHELFTDETAKIWIQAYFEPIGKLGSLSLVSGAYLLRAINLARAFVPPLIKSHFVKRDPA